MFKQLCSLLLPLLFVGPSFAQGDEGVSSLLDQASAVSSLDDRISYLDSLTTVWSNEHRPDGDDLFERLLFECKENEVEEELMPKVTRYARYKVNQGDVKAAREIMVRYTDWVEGSTDLNQQRRYFYNLSYIEELMENRETSLELIDKAIVISEVLQDSTSIIFGEVYKSKGRICNSTGRFAEAVVQLNTARKIFTAVGDSIGIAESLMELGTMHAMIGLYDESERYLLERHKFLPRDVALFRSQDAVNLGRNDLLQNKFESAYRRYHGAIADTADTDIYVNAYIFNGLIESSYFSGRYDAIPDLYTLMIRSLGKLRQNEGLGFLFDQSQFFNDLVQGDLPSAEHIGLRLYEQSIAKRDAAEAMLHARFLTELYKVKGNNGEALRYSEHYGLLRDSILTANKTHALLLYQTQFETKEKENEIARLDSEHKVQESRSSMFLSIAAGLLAVLVIGGALFFQLRKAKNTLAIQNRKLEEFNITKDKFIGIIGHDLRNPIITFEALGDRIRRQKEKGELDGIDETLDRIERNTQQVGDLLDNLMHWVLSQKGVMSYKPESLELKDFLSENVGLFDELATEKGIEILLEVDEDLRLEADKNALSGICRNLISNAVKFTPVGGAVRVNAKRNKEGVVLEFKDSGEGIPQAVQEQLFALGTESKRGTAGETGTGLGLVLVQELVELNRAKITYETEPGRGTIFRVQF